MSCYQIFQLSCLLSSFPGIPINLRTIQPIIEVITRIKRSPPNATLAKIMGLPCILLFSAAIIQPIIQIAATNLEIRLEASKIFTFIT